MDPKSVKRAPVGPVDARIASLEKELAQYIRVQEVLVAAGLVSDEKIQQAHEIVRKFE